MIAIGGPGTIGDDDVPMGMKREVGGKAVLAHEDSRQELVLEFFLEVPMNG